MKSLLGRSTGSAIPFAILCMMLISCGRTSQKQTVTTPGRATPPAVSSVSHSKDQPELVLQFPQSRRLLDVAFATCAPVLAVSNEDGQVDIWDTRSWTLERTIETGSKVTSLNYISKTVAISPDGKSLAYVTDAGQVQIWNTHSGTLVKKLPGSVGLPVSVKWSSDGAMIAAGSKDLVRIWNVAASRVIRSLRATGDVAFSGDGKRLVTAGETNAFLFDIASGRKILSFRDKAGANWPIAISPDGRYVATGGEDPNWRPEPLPRDEEGNEYAPSEAFYAHELKVKIWDARTGRRLKMLPGNSNTGGGTKVLQFTSDGRRLFSAGDGIASVWSVSTNRHVRSFNIEGPSALSPDGRVVAVAGENLSVYSVVTGRDLIRGHAMPTPIRSLAFSSEGGILAAGDQGTSSTSLRLWDTAKGRLSLALSGPPPDLHDVNFLASNKVLSNSLNGTFVWNRTTGKLLAKYKGPLETDFMDLGSRLWQLLTPDGSYLVSQSTHGKNNTYTLRTAATGKVHNTISSTYSGSLRDAVFSPDGRYIAFPTDTQHGAPTAEIWGIRTGAKVSDVGDSGESALLLSFAQNGKSIAGSLPSSGRTPEGRLVADNKIAIWDTGTGKAKRQKVLAKEPARALAFSPDGHILAAGIGAEIHLYSADSLGDLGAMRAGGAPVSALVFSPDGSRVASGHEDGRVRLWDARSRMLLITMLGFASAKGQDVSLDWIAYTANGRYDWSPGAAGLIRWRYKGKLYPAAAFRQLRQQGRQQTER